MEKRKTLWLSLAIVVVLVILYFAFRGAGQPVGPDGLTDAQRDEIIQKMNEPSPYPSDREPSDLKVINKKMSESL